MRGSGELFVVCCMFAAVSNWQQPAAYQPSKLLCSAAAAVAVLLLLLCCCMLLSVQKCWTLLSQALHYYCHAVLCILEGTLPGFWLPCGWRSA
jgi:hypothetical protein